MKYLALLFILTVFACEQPNSALTTDEIIEKAIAVSCSGKCDGAEVQFDFRGRNYRSWRKGGRFALERITPDSLGIYKDVLDNDGFRRYRNDTLWYVEDSMAIKYANSVNSVHYFMQLPYGLNDPAVIKQLMDTCSVNKEPYFRIKIRFKEEGGGNDFEDVFLYWIHREHFTVDFIAYSYLTDGGGVRFREAFNSRVIDGIRFSDYRNYKPQAKDIPLESLDTLFVQGKLELLSSIENTNIRVRLLEE